MWSAGVSKLRMVGLLNARYVQVLNPHCCYSTIKSPVKRPAIYLYNSSTRAELFLIGIDHITQRSADLVQNLIKDVKPKVVAVELCERRAEQLMAGPKEPHRPRMMDFFSMKGGLGQKSIAFLIRNMYADLACAGLKPGRELRVAIEKGKDVGAKIAYIDEDFDVMVERASQDFSLKSLYRYWVKRKELDGEYPNFFGALRYRDISHVAEAMLKPDALKETIEIGERFFPGLVQAIVHDRNEHMVKQLREMKGSIVGVVGALHVKGMQKLWDQAERECQKDRALPVLYAYK